LLDVSTFKGIIIKYYQFKINRLATKPEGMDDRVDNNKILNQILAVYVYRIVRLVLVIFTISYFVGTLWFIFVMRTADEGESNFYLDNEMEEQTDFYKYSSFLHLPF